MIYRKNRKEKLKLRRADQENSEANRAEMKEADMRKIRLKKAFRRNNRILKVAGAAAGIIATILAVVMSVNLVGPYIHADEQEQTKYVSEVKLFTASTPAEAKSACEDAGYICQEDNLNEGTGQDCVYLGYKITYDKDEAITDIHMLEMNNGYEMQDYSAVAEATAENAGVTVTEYMSSIAEFTTNYQNGSPAANAALEMLNLIYIPEENNARLGDYLVSGSASTDILKKIFQRSTTAVITLLFSAMVPGVADYNRSDGTNWAERVNNSVITDLAEGDGKVYSELDNKYGTLAQGIKDQVVSFAESYNKGIAAAKDIAQPINTEQVSADTTAEVGSETIKTLSDDDLTDESEYAAILLAYDALNEYTYDGTTPLGEWLVSVGTNTDFSTSAGYRVLYPLVEALTTGQVGTLKINGIAQMAMYLSNSKAATDGSVQKADDLVDEKIADAKKTIMEYNGQDSMSVWAGADLSLYEKKIAMTTDAIRARSAGYQFEKFTATDKFEEGLSNALKYISIISGAISVCWGLTVIGFSFYAGSMTMATSGLLAIAGQLIAGSTLSAVCGVLGGAFVVLNILAVVVLVIVIVIFLVYKIIDWLSEDDDEAYTDIPGQIYDLKNSKYVKYELVSCGTNTDDQFNMDLNGGDGKGKRWNVLYTTKTEAAGDPIVVNDYGVFKVQYGNSNSPSSDFEALTNFGSVTPSNTNANAKSDSKGGCYIFFARKNVTTKQEETSSEETTTSQETTPAADDSSKTDEEEKEEKETETETETTSKESSASTSGAKYISSISLATYDTESAAKNYLKSKGYSVLDMNLSGESGKYCYLGYKTTNNADSAVKDIRIGVGVADDPILYGAGSYANCGTTPSGDSIYYTSSSEMGTPVLSIQVVDSFAKAGEGFEPVNPFSGGRAFNLTRDFNENGLRRYIYFEPETKYTNGTKYLGGFAVVSELYMSNNKNTLRFNSYSGMSNLSSYDLVGDYVDKSWDDSATGGDRYLDTYIVYSETYNPYRAIYDIATYTCEPTATSPLTSLGSTSGRGGYTIVTNYYENGKTADRSESYIGVEFSGGYLPGINRLEAAADPAEGYSWTSSTVRLKNFYVKGRTAGATPLTRSILYMTDNGNGMSDMVSVQDLKTPYYESAYNIGLDCPNESNKGHACYLYIEKTVTKKQYISSISVVSFDLETFMGNSYKTADDDQKDNVRKMANDLCFSQLLASCNDEIILSNLAESRSNSLMGKSSDYTTNCAYIGVTRTDNQSAAITGIIKYKPADGTAPSQITVNGIKYTRAGTQKLGKINDSNGAYWLYYTTGIASNNGVPITDITIDDVPIVEGASTSLTAKAVDGDTKASLAADLKDKNYVHATFNVELGYIEALFVGHGKTKTAALEDLLSQGCTQAVDLDLNYNAGGEYIYLGYKKYMPSANEKTPKYAVYDIIYTVGQPYQKSITYNGVKYSAASESTTKTTGTGTSLTSGTNGGEELYIYYTRKQFSGVSSPIVHICGISGDGTPSSERGNWEYIMNTDGKIQNLNEGVISKDNDDKSVKDCRVYTAVIRENGSVKDGAAFTGGAGSLTTNVGELYTSN